MGIISYGWSTAWIVHLLTLRTCEGFISCSGQVIIKPSVVVPVQTNVSITCVSEMKDCLKPGPISVLLNNKSIKTDWMNQTSAGVYLFNVSQSYSIYCSISCSGKNHAICWKDLKVGYPPDPAINLTCLYDENSGIMTCSLKKGWETHISTKYTVHIKNLQTDEYRQIQLNRGLYNVTIQVNKSCDKSFEVYVEARNNLGQSKSDTQHIQLSNIVVPVRPAIKIQVLNTHFEVTVYWKKQTLSHLHYCELAYRAKKQPMWTLVNEQTLNNSNILIMKNNSEAKDLRVRCREERGQSYWSSWSDATEIPQIAPMEMFDVWRSLGPVHSNGTQEVTVFIKSMAPDVPWRKALGYKLFFKNGSKETVIGICKTSQSQCKTIVPKGIKAILVSAYNSYGDSCPSLVNVLQDSQERGVFPAPQNLSVRSGIGIRVLWNFPKESEASVLWFILQWVLPCNGKQDILWNKIPRDQRHFVIKDIIDAGSVVKISLYAIYSSGFSRPCVGYGFSKELEPKAGPDKIIKKSTGDQTLIQWEEIPLCDRKGFISGYTLHLTEDSNGETTKYESTTKEYTFDQLHSGALYTVCLTASTKAGEGPCGKHILLKKDKSLYDYTKLLVGISFGVMILSAFTLTLLCKKSIQARLKRVLVPLTPNFLHEKCPHIEKSTALQSLQGTMDVSKPCFINSYYDPDITEVEESEEESFINPDTSTEYSSVVKNNEVITLDKPFLETIGTNSHVAERMLGYMPQTAQRNVSRRDSYCSPAQMLNIQLAALDAVTARNNTSTFSNLFAEKCGTERVPTVSPDSHSLKNSNIVDIQFLKALPNASLENSIERQSSGNIMEGNTFPGNETTCCLTTTDADYSVTKTYFPQVFARET
ncbi:hypothetical protein XENTR_v10011860 [Xenopus tropicalis]|uniref:Interleukin-12 receptor subunit beta-2 n=1 Tax=Xenopus tropicalis TaxID=8364 RepID=A0A803J7H1_XENTR|nr:interleukin-12 receptor subunit beta-2 [Xenopus tropicalis]XP_031756739.1 interleukin-12 receptor subunit beta-2 [Xenopus tropicalis]KAE8609621.1 hypothetical protein XENTR_v10011860 [Xenopus tropicalis]KAE8609622.1 hypothetical protein XENTR_v10011860 [Xenopus tropicalis]